jgi:hypothetical protein
VAFIRKRFGIEMGPQHFSAVKSQFKRQGGPPRGKRGRKPKQAVEGYLAPPPRQRQVDGETGLLSAMEAMKPLVESLGVEKVKRIAELLG